MTTSTTSYLTDDITRHTEAYVQAFNTNDPDILETFYTEEAIAVWEPGKPLSGAERRASIREFLSRGAVMTATDRQRFVTNDTALLIVDWSVETTDADGNPEHLEGVGVDVIRKGADGLWRYAVDDPFGQPA